jgi:hypothetical protein
VNTVPELLNQVRNLRKMAIFQSKLVSFLLSITNPLFWKNILPWTNTLAYYGIRKLQIRSVFYVTAVKSFIVQAPVEYLRQ